MTELQTASGLPLIEVYCCREWLVMAFKGWGRCGYCQQIPSQQRPKNAD